jgi:hypothetical protein
MNIADTDELTQPSTLFHAHEFNLTHWNLVRPLIKSIICSDNYAYDSTDTIWVRVIAHELRRLKVRQSIAVNLLKEWVQAVNLKDHIVRVVNESYNEFTSIERSTLANKIVNPKINSLPKSANFLYLKLLKVYRYNQFEASYADLEKLTGLSNKTIIRSILILKNDNLIEHYPGTPTKKIKGGAKSVIKLIPPEEYKL